MSQLEHEIDQIEEGKSALNQEKALRNKNAAGLLKNPNTRPKVIFTAVALVFMSVIGLVLINKAGNDEDGDEAETSFANPNIRGDNSVTLNPSMSQAYNDLKSKDNEQKAKEAEAKGGTHIEIPVTAVKKEEVVEEVTQPAVTNVQQPVAPVVYNRDVTYDSGMQSQFEAILASFEYKAPRTVLVQSATNNAAPAPAAPSAVQVATNAPVSNEDNFFIKAGSISVGTIDMEANSDEPGEVLATIRTGELKGAKAICNFTKGKEALKLKCPLVSPTWGNDSFAANILLVDPDTNRANMATEVDHHYMERYGLILASSFIQGLGEAAVRANSVISTSPLGSTQTQGAIDAGDTLLVAAGRAGSTASAELSRRGDIPVTVKVKAGQPVGFLFLTDFKAKRPTTM